MQRLFDNGVQMKKMGQSRCKPLRVSRNRVRKCPKELVKDKPETTGVKDPQEAQDFEDLQEDSSYEIEPR